MRRTEDWGAFLFPWMVPEAGYMWVEDAMAWPPEYTEMAPHLVAQGCDERLLTFPLEEKPTLFVKFANLGATKQPILRFASKHGALGVGKDLYSESWGPPAGSPFSGWRPTGDGPFPDARSDYYTLEGREYLPLLGESLATWRDEIDTFWPLYWVWDRLENDDWQQIGEHIIWNTNSVQFHMLRIQGERVPGRLDSERVYGPEDEPYKITCDTIAHSTHRHPELFKAWGGRDIRGPARQWLLEKVNNNLKAVASPQLRLDQKGNVLPHIVPHNLLGAMWVQLYSALSGQRKFRPCIICKEWMDVTFNNKNKRVHDTCSQQARNEKRQQKLKAENRK